MKNSSIAFEITSKILKSCCC